MTVDPTAATESIERQLRQLGTPKRARGEKAYLKSELVHLGATVWEIRRAVREFTSKHRDLTTGELTELAFALWSEPVHERRMAAVVLLEQRADLLGPADLTFIEQLIRNSRTWAYVDGLAGDVVGSIMVRYPDAAPRLDSWAADSNFWLRRSALLAQLQPLKRGAPFTCFAGYAEAMLEEKEFFICKAIGWVLREAGKTRAREVHRWLLPRAGRASGVTIREAVKYLEPESRRSSTLAVRPAPRLITPDERRPSSRRFVTSSGWVW